MSYFWLWPLQSCAPSVMKAAERSLRIAAQTHVGNTGTGYMTEQLGASRGRQQLPIVTSRQMTAEPLHKTDLGSQVVETAPQ